MHRLTYDCRCVLVPALALTFLASSGCGVLWSRTVPMPPEPLKVLVAQVTLKAPVTSPTDLHSFNDAPPPEIQPMLLAQLIDEVQVHAQRAFIEELSRQQAFQPVPFQEARLMLSDMPFTGEELSEAALAILGDRVGADIVVPGRILDYGAIQWQYWVSGLALSMLTETLVVGAATGFNPAIMAATAASELVTDLPFCGEGPMWGGGHFARCGSRQRPFRSPDARSEFGRSRNSSFSSLAKRSQSIRPRSGNERKSNWRSICSMPSPTSRTQQAGN